MDNVCIAHYKDSGGEGGREGGGEGGREEGGEGERREEGRRGEGRERGTMDKSARGEGARAGGMYISHYYAFSEHEHHDTMATCRYHTQCTDL